MDISLKAADGTFNYRVAAILLHAGRLLVMRDEASTMIICPAGGFMWVNLPKQL